MNLTEETVKLVTKKCAVTGAIVAKDLEKGRTSVLPTNQQIVALNDYFRRKLGGGVCTVKGRCALAPDVSPEKWLVLFSRFVLAPLTQSSNDKEYVRENAS